MFIVYKTLPPGVVLLPYRVAGEDYRILFDGAEIVLNSRRTNRRVTCCYACAQAVADREVTEALNIDTIQRAEHAS